MKKRIIIGMLAILSIHRPIVSSEAKSKKSMFPRQSHAHHTKSRINIKNDTDYYRTILSTMASDPVGYEPYADSDNVSSGSYNTISSTSFLPIKPISNTPHQVKRETAQKQTVFPIIPEEIAISIEQKMQLVTEARARIEHRKAQLEYIKNNRKDFEHWGTGIIKIMDELTKHKEKDLCFIDWIDKCVPTAQHAPSLPFLSQAQALSFVTFAKTYTAETTGPLTEND